MLGDVGTIAGLCAKSGVGGTEGKRPAARCGQAPEPLSGAPKAQGWTAGQPPETHSARRLARVRRTCPTDRASTCTPHEPAPTAASASKLLSATAAPNT